MTRAGPVAALLLSAGTLLLAPSAAAQTPLSLDAFDGWEAWPLARPGDLAVATGELTPVRIEFDGLFPGPNGFGAPPLQPLTMVMDLRESNFHAEPALWIQWTSRPPADGAGAPALDVLLVDRRSFRLLFRIGASNPGEWAGRYEVIQAAPDELVQVTIDEDGAAEKHALPDPPALFDFATYPFLFAFMELRDGRSLRLAGWEYVEKRPEILAARVIGRTEIEDADGTAHEVWRVDVMPSHRATLISFYVTPEPPYFYGWDYRLTRDGSLALQLRLRSWRRMS